MENEANPLVLELSRFQELFKAHLEQPSSSESLIMEMLSCLDKSMSLARTSVPAAQQPTSPLDVEARLMNKKRKKMTKSTIEQRVVVQTGMGDGQLSDRRSWRKYGQKTIQFAKYPRCYYRCPHSEARNCPAKKQVQQSDENPSTFVITYIGTHTCYVSPQQSDENLSIFEQVQQSDKNPSTYIGTHTCYLSPQQSDENLSIFEQVQQSDKNPSTFEATYIGAHTCYPSPQQSYENPSTFEVPCIGTHTCYPNPQQHCLNINTEVSGSDLASPSLMFPTTPENCFMGNFSPSPIAAETSGTNFFSKWDMREGPSLQAASSSFAGNIWEENSAAISPFLGMDMESLLNQG